MAIKAGQYLLNPAAAGAVLGGSWATAANLTEGTDWNVGQYATNGALLGGGLGAALMGYKGYKNFKVGSFTTPMSKIAEQLDTSKVTPGTKKLLENLF